MYTRLLKIASIPPYQSFFLFGPRQTGKSTLVNNYLKESGCEQLVYNLLYSETYLRLQTSPWLMRNEIQRKLAKSTTTHPLQVLIDEVQRVPALLDEVHGLIESHPKKIRFILSGSSARKLRHGGANLLAGRAWLRHLYPLSCLEMGDDFYLEDALQYGTLPSLAGKPPEEKREQLRSYVSAYLREEVQAEALVRRLDSFHRFLDAAAHSNGSLLNLSTIAQEASVPRRTVSSYYQILEDTLLGFFHPSWGHRVSRKELVTHGKFYFFDTGIVNALTQNLTTTFTPKNPLYGDTFEHFCLLEFLRLHDYKGTEHKTGFYRTRAGAEVDLIAEKAGKIRAIEIKSSTTISNGQIRGLLHFGEEFPQAELIVVCRTPQAFALGRVQCMPWKEFFQAE